MRIAIAALISLFGGLAQASECSVAGLHNSVIFEGHERVEKAAQFVAEKKAGGGKFLFGFPETSSIIATYENTIVIKYTVSLMQVYAANDKIPAGSRDVLVVLNRANCALVGKPMDLGANN